MKREITLSVLPSLLMQPILDGEMGASGLEVRARQARTMDTNARRMAQLEFDVGETSLATYLRGRDQGVRAVALPVFSSNRRLPHGNFRVALHTGIRDLSGLRGHTVAATQYWTASSIWQRQFLLDEYGLAPEDMAWVTFQAERMEGLEVPAALQHRLEDRGRSADELAAAGEIQATLTTGAGSRRDSGAEGRAPALGPAFPDPAGVEREYYDRTGLYPIHHVVVIREELAEREPWIVDSLCDTFIRAKGVAQAREQRGSSASPRAGETTEEMAALFGDGWPYGISANRKTLEAFVDAAHRQGLTSRRYTVDELFASSLPEALK